MKITFLSVAAVLAFSMTAVAGDLTSQELANWHQWRGPLASGFAPNADPPVEWSESKNIRWKVAIPGDGTATPIVWGDRIYLLTAIETERKGEAAQAANNEAADEEPAAGENDGKKKRGGRGGGGGGLRPAKPSNIHQFVVMCLDRKSGETIWQKVAREELPHEGHHKDHGYASASPTTDGKHLYVSFGSRGIYCYDLEGNNLWEQDLGDMKTRNGFGEGASPTVAGDRLIVVWDHEADSFVTALDTATGQPVWKQNREEPTCWSTPLVVEHDGKEQVVINATNRTRSYDLKTGDLIWECGGQTTNAIPSPVTADGVVYCMSGFRGSAALAIPLSASGNVTDTDAVKWKLSDGTPYCPSPLLYDDLLYFNKSNNGILTVVNAKSGAVLIENQRLDGVRNVYASPVGAAGRVYFIGRDGSAVVLEHGPEYKVLATNKLDEGIDASPALVGKEMFLRGKDSLYCIAAE